MSQFDFATIDPNAKSGTQLAVDLNNWRDALHSCHRGAARPVYAQGGMLWVRETSAEQWDLMFYDGDTDFVLRSVNPTTNELIGIPRNSVQGLNESLDDIDAALSSLVKQSNLTDTTPGRLQQVGAFGLGGPAILQSGDINSLSVTQFFLTTPDTTNVPVGAGTSTGQGYGVHVQHSNSAFATQRWVQLSTNRIFERVKNNGTWLDWVELFNTGSVSSFAQTLLDDVDAAAARTTLGVVNSVGASQTWQNVTSSRALGVTYTNTTGRPIVVSVTVTALTCGLSITVGGVVVARQKTQVSGGDVYASVTAVVPVGGTYSASLLPGGTPVLDIWTELR